jgi:hypothetical protein
MRPPPIVTVLLLAVAAACTDTAAPVRSNQLSYRIPRFSLASGPATAANDTSCGQGVAYAFGESGHLSNTSAAFLLTGTTPRDACGSIAFNEQLAWSGRLAVGYTPGGGHVNDCWYFVRTYRVEGAPLDYDSLPLLVVCGSGASRHDTVSAIALEDKELLFFELSAHKAPMTDDSFPPPESDTLRWAGESHGGFHLWASLAPIDTFVVSVVNGNHPRVWWQNAHSGRVGVDLTEIYRRVGEGQWDRRDSLPAGDTLFTDTAVTDGTYAYYLRHTAAYAPNHLWPGILSIPNSPTTAAKTALVNVTPPDSTPPAPIPLRCEGNFSPTIDCWWENASTNSYTVLYRDGAAKDTVDPGVSTCTDATVQSGYSYQYKMRHLNGTHLSPDTNEAVTGVASPVPPENLSCGGTSTSTATCVWINKENAQTQVWRRRNPHYELVATLDAGVDSFEDSELAEGVTYTYRVRHKSGGAYTDWSNTDEATPGSVPEPYRPRRP